MSITMNYMPGKRLDEAWDTLAYDQKLSIADELHSYVVQLRCLKGEYIGAIDQGKATIEQLSSIEGAFQRVHIRGYCVISTRYTATLC